MAEKPIVIRTKNGAEYGFPDEAAARERFGEGVTVVRYQDGTALDAPSEKPLSALTRDELNQRAAAAGIAEPEKLPNKDAVVAAIEGAA